MTYVAFNHLRKQRLARRCLGIGLLLLGALCGGCASRCFGDSAEECARDECGAPTSELSVVSVTPSDGAANVEPGTSVGIEFSREIDPATVSSETFTVMDGDTPVSGTTRCDGLHVTFTPHTKLSLLAEYSIVVRSTVTDRDGVPMREDFTSKFTVRDGTWTRTARPTASRAWLSGLTVDADGSFVLGLTESAPSARRYSEGAWSTPTAVGCDGCFDYLLRGNGRGDALAVAVDSNGAARARRFHERNWQASESEVLPLTGYVPQALVSAAVAPNGEAHVLLVDDRVIRTRHTHSTGAWSEARSTPVADTMYFRPVLAFDSGGSGFAAWVAYDDDDHRSGIHVMRFDSDIASSVESIPESWEKGQSLGQVALAMTARGDAVAVWGGRGGLQTSAYTGKTWSSARLVTDTASGTICVMPTVVDDGDDLIAAWGQAATDSSTQCSVYTSRWRHGTWSEPELRGNADALSSNPPLLAADPHGNIMLIWNTETQVTFERFNATKQQWIAPSPASEGFGAPNAAIAVATNGVVMAAFEAHGEVATALFK